jgi:hypothetical protein
MENFYEQQKTYPSRTLAFAAGNRAFNLGQTKKANPYACTNKFAAYCYWLLGYEAAKKVNK